jgi:ABC-type oligopeptide transport system ATPase subunit
MISHDFKEIYTVCNKIAIMRKGQLIELGNKDEIILNPIHPYTIELLCDYLRYYQNSPSFLCPLMNIEISEVAPITTISPTHFVRSRYLDKRSLKLELPSNIEQIKEQIYENIRN